MRVLLATVATLLLAVLFQIGGSTRADAAVLSVGGPNAPYGGYVCADVRNNDLAVFTPVQAFDCHGGTNQDFQLIGKLIYALSGQRCLDVLYARTAPGTPVESYTCNGTSAQQWYYYNGQLVNLGSYLCLDARTMANFVQLIINTCNSALPSQQWQFK